MKYCNVRIFKKMKRKSDEIFSWINNAVKAIYNNELDNLKNDIFEYETYSLLTNGNTIKTDNNKAGIYLFVANNDFQLDVKCFNKCTYGAKVNKRNCGLKGDENLEVKKGDVFYLGKSYEIYNRLVKHLTDNCDSSTYSLKLEAENRKYYKDKLDVHLFILKEDYTDYKAIILPSIEERLHKELKPKVGSART